MGKHKQSVDNQVWERIQSHEPGWVFTPRDFLDLGSRAAVGSALKRYKQAGVIRHVARGLYDTPIHNSWLGILSPSSEEIVKALATNHSWRLQPSGAYAANILGLSEQVPMKVVLLTDGPSKRVKIGRREIMLKHTTTKNMATAGRVSGLVIQALRYLSRQYVDDNMVALLRRRLSAADKQQLLKDIRYAPAWIADIMRWVAQPEAR